MSGRAFLVIGSMFAGGGSCQERAALVEENARMWAEVDRLEIIVGDRLNPSLAEMRDTHDRLAAASLRGWVLADVLSELDQREPWVDAIEVTGDHLELMGQEDVPGETMQAMAALGLPDVRTANGAWGFHVDAELTDETTVVAATTPPEPVWDQMAIADLRAENERLKERRRVFERRAFDRARFEREVKDLVVGMERMANRCPTIEPEALADRFVARAEEAGLTVTDVGAATVAEGLHIDQVFLPVELHGPLEGLTQLVRPTNGDARDDSFSDLWMEKTDDGGFDVRGTLTTCSHSPPVEWTP